MVKPWKLPKEPDKYNPIKAYCYICKELNLFGVRRIL